MRTQLLRDLSSFRARSESETIESGSGVKSVPGSMYQYCHKDAVPRVIDDPNDD
jgi:hypothetical protein